MKTIAILAVGLSLTTHAFAVNYGNYKYIKSNGLTNVESPQGLVFSAVGAAANPTYLGADGLNIFGLPSGTVPSGMTTMVMKFDFKSNGFFAAEPSAHLPILLLATWQNNNPTPPSPGSGSGFLIGRGIAIGNVSGAPNGCTVSNIVVVESFWATSNKLFPSTCSAGGTGTSNVRLSDYTTYRFEISASKTNYIQGQNVNVLYKIYNSSGVLLQQASVLDINAQIPTTLGGWGVGRTLSNVNPNSNWSIEFNNLSIDYIP